MTHSITDHHKILAEHSEGPPIVAEAPPEEESDVPKD